MPIVEHNDVDISKLFAWSKESVITGLKGKDMKVYIRLLGDADNNRARIASLRLSAELRKALRDPESDERLAFIPDIEELDKELLVESIVIYTMRENTKRAMKEVVIPKPKDPGSDATTEKLEKFQQAVDDYPSVREKAIRELLEKYIEDQRKELDKKSEEELYKIYIKVLSDELCEQELLNRFREYCAFFGTYTNKNLTKKLFDSYEEFDNLPREVKSKLIEEYQLLEVESEHLKK